MALTADAVFPQGINTGTAVTTLLAAITGDTPSNTVKIFTAGANGALLTRLSALPRSTAAANSLYAWVSSDTGTTKRLIKAKLVASDTVSTTDIPTEIDFGYSLSAPLLLKAGEEVYVGQGVSDPATNGWVWRAEGRDM